MLALLETEDERARSGDLVRVFPYCPVAPAPATAAEATKYLQFTATPRYYNFLLAAWTLHWGASPDQGTSAAVSYQPPRVAPLICDWAGVAYLQHAVALHAAAAATGVVVATARRPSSGRQGSAGSAAASGPAGSAAAAFRFPPLPKPRRASEIM